MAEGLAAIILAAGFSSRMGASKALLPLGPSTVLEQVIALFHQCALTDIIVVTGHQAGAITQTAARAGARVVHNPDFTRGMFSSICAGIRALAPDTRGFFLLPVDIPLIRKGSIILPARAFVAASPLLAYPDYYGRRGHPPLISTALAQSICNDEGSQGLRGVLAAVEANNPGRVLDVAVPDANILFDMDTPEDYEHGRALFAVRDTPTLDESRLLVRDISPLSDRGLAHAEQVAEVAVAICDLLATTRTPPPDRDLCRVCGLLHDLAKGQPNHEEEGGRRLSELGFDRAAAIVAAHREPAWVPGMEVTETEIVFLADKLVKGANRVDLAARFQEKLELYARDPAACDAIRRRLSQAQGVWTAIDKETGGALTALLAGTTNET